MHRTLHSENKNTTFMAIYICIVVLIFATVFCSFLFLHFIKKNGSPWILPCFLLNIHRIHDCMAETLEKNNGTILLKCAWFSGYDVLFTGDPANVRHITSTKFSNYPKGPEWKKRFELFGDSVFSLDFEEWTYHRKVVRAYLSHQQFQQFNGKIIRDCIETELIPALQHVSNQQTVVDLQGLLRRYIYCFACCISTGYKPKFFNFAFSEDPYTKATDDACEAISARYLVPESFWKLQSWLGFGKEKKLSEAWKTVDHIFHRYMLMKQEEISKGETRDDAEDFSALKGYMTRHEIFGPKPTSHKIIKDSIFSLIFAIQDTTSTVLSWFFWLLSTNPKVEAKIREELKTIRQMAEAQNFLLFNEEELSKMVYLQAALSETLRLFPPAAMLSRTALEMDTLPSGHHVNQNTIVMLCTHAMGRMTFVWGQDSHEFKPERWITEDGRIRHEPPHKFSAFSTGPRICPGKDVAFTLLKAFAATIIHNYHVEVVKDHLVVPKSTFILHLNHGLMVKLKKRGT